MKKSTEPQEIVGHCQLYQQIYNESPRRREEKGGERIVKEIMAPNLLQMETINMNIQEAHKTPSGVSQKRSTPRYIIDTFKSPKQKILKAARRK